MDIPEMLNVIDTKVCKARDRGILKRVKTDGISYEAAVIADAMAAGRPVAAANTRATEGKCASTKREERGMTMTTMTKKRARSTK